MGQCSKNQSSAGAKFKVIKFRSTKDHFNEEKLTVVHRKYALLKFNSQVTLITSLSGLTSRYTITANTTIFKEYNEILFIAPQHVANASSNNPSSKIQNNTNSKPFSPLICAHMLIFHLPIKDLVFNKPDGLL